MERKNFSWPVTAMNREDYEAFCLWFGQNEERLKDHQLVIWGAGIRGTGFSILLREKGFLNFIFVDGNPEKWGGCIDAFDIISPEQLEAERKDKQRIILISVENSAAIEQQLDAKGYRKGTDYFLAKTTLYSDYVEEFLRPYGQDALVMGDCEFLTMSIRDTDRSSLKDKLFERCGQSGTKILAMHGIGLRAEYNIYRGQTVNGMKPKRLVIMINFETLTGKQHLMPRSQHLELMEELLAAQKNPTGEFAEYVRLAEQRSKNLQMEFFTGEENTEIFSEIKARNYMRLNYLYDLDVQTEGIEYLIRILEESAAEGVNVLPFIPPVNYELGRRIFGDVFDKKYRRNVEKVEEVVTSRGFRLLDLSYVLKSDLFSTPLTPSETANSAGRERLADLLYCAIQEMR